MRKLVLIPSTFTGEKKDKKLRIFLISLIARAFVNFGIHEVGIYYDPDPKFDSHGLGRFLVKVLKYLNTPPYLRKLAFPKENELKEIGAALPITAEYHVNTKRYVYVYVLKRNGEKFVVSDGKNTFTVKTKKKIRNTRILVYDKVRKDFVEKWEAEEYIGYEVFYFNKTLDKLLEKLRNRGFYIIGTSRYGIDIRKANILNKSNVAIVFGSFARGLKEILGEGWKEYFDIIINTVPNQLLKTIRTEEAILYTLATLRYRNII